MCVCFVGREGAAVQKADPPYHLLGQTNDLSIGRLERLHQGNGSAIELKTKPIRSNSIRVSVSSPVGLEFGFGFRFGFF